MKYILVTNQHEYITNNGNKIKNVEYTSLEFIEYFVDNLTNIGKDVIIYVDRESFRNNIVLHKNDFVINFDFGYKSRTRNMGVPALCELYNIDYFNPDPYVQILCQDKYLTKKYIESFGIKTPLSILVSNENSIKYINNLQYPLIIKPNYESESIGITQDSIVTSEKDAKNIINKKLKEFNDAIIVEEYIEGNDIAITLCRDNNEIDIFFEVEIQICGLKENQYNAFTYEIKNQSFKNVYTKKIKSNYINDEEKEKLKLLFKSLRSGRLIRIDGRFQNNIFYALEINANPGLYNTSIVPQTFNCYGYNYKDMMKILFNKY